MIDLTLAQIADIVGGELADISAAEAAATRVTGTVEFDSRAVTPGGLFLALPGARSDGHDFAAAAVAAGAVAVLAARPVGVPAIVVEPARCREPTPRPACSNTTPTARAPRCSPRWRGWPPRSPPSWSTGGLTIVGITGSSGKTSTKDLLAAVLAPLGEVVAPPGSFNNELGHPWTVLRATESTDYLVLEMSARHPGNIAALAAIAPPSIAVVLNVGTAHLGEFGSREAIAATKAELPQAVPSSGVVILNVDDAAVAAMADQTAARVVRVARVTPAPTCGPAPSRSTSWPGRASRCTPPASRSTSRWPCTATTRCPTRCAPPPSRWSAAPASNRWPPRWRRRARCRKHRMQVATRGDGVTVINDAYNANPDSMRAGLKALAWMAREGGRNAAQLGGARRDGRARRRRDIRA